MINAFWHIRPMRYAALMLLFLLLIIVPWSGSADAYEYDHYALTYYLALQVGFTKRQAFQIASATYALDFDPNLSPMQATAGDAIIGANHALFGVFGNRKPELAAIWSNFHAFADEQITKACTDRAAWMVQAPNPNNQCGDTIMLPNQPAQHGTCPPEVFAGVENSRKQRKQALALLANQEGNPGVLLHYLQDYYAHFAFDNFSGHAIASHIPDFLSADPAKAECAARDTIGALEEFLCTVTSFGGPHEPLLRQKPVALDRARMSRISEVLAQLIQINPVVGSYLPWESPTHLSAEGADRAAPLPGRSIAVIDNAILKDEQDGRLPKWPGKVDNYEALMPPDFFRYSYAPDGRIIEPNDVLMLRTPGPVEQVAFKLGTYKLDTTPSTEHPGMLKVHLRLPYAISGLAAMFDGKQNNYLTPLPVIEKDRLSDESEFASHEQRRSNGDFAVEREVEKNETDLDKTSWTVSVQLYGYDPVEKTISLAPQAPDLCSILTETLSSLPENMRPSRYTPSSQVSSPLGTETSACAADNQTADLNVLDNKYGDVYTVNIGILWWADQSSAQRSFNEGTASSFGYTYQPVAGYGEQAAEGWCCNNANYVLRIRRGCYVISVSGNHARYQQPFETQPFRSASSVIDQRVSALPACPNSAAAGN